MLKNKKFAIAFFSWMIFVSWACLSTFPEDDAPKIDIPNFDKVVHFCFYFGAAVLGTLCVWEAFRKCLSLTGALAMVVLSVVSFGIIIEILQYALTTDRSGDMYDALANTCGAVVGAFAMNIFFSKEIVLRWQ